MRRAGCIQSHLASGRRGPPPEPLPTTAHVASESVLYDTVIRGGSAFEADGHAPGTVLDLAIKDGLIAAIELPGAIPAGAGAEEVDATDMVLCPGLIDAHAHVFTGMTPLGIDPDEWCLGRGCTTVVDAGSAGATTVEGFIRYIDGQSLTRCLSFVNIGMHGLAGSGGAYAHVNQIKAEPAIDAIRKYPEHIVGVKVLLTASYANGGRSEYEALRAGLEATAATGVPIVTHHSSSTIPLNPQKPRLEQHELADTDLGCPYSLRAGDIYTHCFHAFKSTIIDGGSHIRSIDPGNGVHDVVPNPDGDPDFGDFHVSETVWEAKRRGVLFDVGHGSASFSWTVAELAAKEGFWPDLISTDIHTGSCFGPAYDQCTCMTKMLMVGMPLAEVIRASTSTPAKAIGYADKIGTLRVGLEADVAVLEIRRTDFARLQHHYGLLQFVSDLEDSQAQLRKCSQRLICRACWKAGQAARMTTPEQVGQFPNLKNIALHRPSWNILVCRDVSPPKEVSPEFREMVRQRLAQMEENAEEWMRQSSVGDGQPNLPLWLTLPWCDMATGEEADEELPEAYPKITVLSGVERASQRMLISYPESDPRLERMRMEATIFAQCC